MLKHQSGNTVYYGNNA